jgi:vacuolar-type H+-ATPase subunit C/Vma6
MPDAGERAYAYTKACGIIGKSFVGKRMSALAGLRSLNELDRLVFPGAQRELPVRELLVDLEKRITRRSAEQIVAVLDSYEKPPELLIRLLRSCEYDDLKTFLNYLADGRKAAPSWTNIGRFATVKTEHFPDLNLMLEGTEFDFLPVKYFKNVQEGNLSIEALETELDNHYYCGLKDGLLRLSGGDRALAQKIISEEISLLNCVWALRLRVYFKEPADEIEKHLIDIKLPVASEDIPKERYAQTSRPQKEISLAAEAVQSLNKDLDSRSDWKGWRWEKLLNPEKPGEMWVAQPRHFQNAASLYLHRRALSFFRQSPFAVSAIFCYIKLKQFEEDILTSITEGLGLGMPCDDVFSLLEVSP